MFIQNIGINGGGNFVQDTLVIRRGIKLQEKIPNKGYLLFLEKRKKSCGSYLQISLVIPAKIFAVRPGDAGPSGLFSPHN